MYLYTLPSSVSFQKTSHYPDYLRLFLAMKIPAANYRVSSNLKIPSIISVGAASAAIVSSHQEPVMSEVE